MKYSSEHIFQCREVLWKYNLYNVFGLFLYLHARGILYRSIGCLYYFFSFFREEHNGSVHFWIWVIELRGVLKIHVFLRIWRLMDRFHIGSGPRDVTHQGWTPLSSFVFIFMVLLSLFDTLCLHNLSEVCLLKPFLKLMVKMNFHMKFKCNS